jgi:Ca2+-binding RTX toxin-like protein
MSRMLRVCALAVLAIAMHGTTAGAVSSTCDGVPATIVGTDGDDVIDGTSGPDVISAGAGNDTVRGFGGNDRICGGPGDDTIDGGPGNDRIFGGAGRDILSDPGGRNVVDGGDGADDISTGEDDDIVRGRDGNDVIRVSKGSDRLTGGEGFDTIDASGIDVFPTQAGIAINLTTGRIHFGFEQSISGFEGIIGTSGADELTGDDGPNVIDGWIWCGDVITGNGGNDVLQTGLGPSPAPTSPCFPPRLSGDDGDDSLIGYLGPTEGGAGNDFFQPLDTSSGTLVGGPGFDIVDYSLLSAAVEVDLETGRAIKKAVTGVHDTLQEIEQVTGTLFADQLTASSAGSVLVGSDGDDELLGLSGADVLRPGKGADDVDGGDGPDVLDISDLTSAVSVDLRAGSAVSGADTDRVVRVESVIGTSFDDTLAGDGLPNYLRGGDGNDLIQGRGGNDVLDGGSGSDRCAGGAGTDAVVACETVVGVP